MFVFTKARAHIHAHTKSHDLLRRIDKNAGSSVGTEDYIFVELDHVPITMLVSVGVGGYCNVVKTNVGYLTKIVDPFGNTWLVRSCAEPPAPVKRDWFV